MLLILGLTLGFCVTSVLVHCIRIRIRLGSGGGPSFMKDTSFHSADARDACKIQVYWWEKNPANDALKTGFFLKRKSNANNVNYIWDSVRGYQLKKIFYSQNWDLIKKYFEHPGKKPNQFIVNIVTNLVFFSLHINQPGNGRLCAFSQMC